VYVSNNQPASAEITRVGKFGLVGILNTLIDFTGYNVLSSIVGLSLVQSNIISTSIAMIFSFTANKKVVFKKNKGSFAKQAVAFFIVTAFGLYVIQTGTIKLLTDVWLAPVTLGLAVAHSLNIVGHDQFLAKNGAKAIATVLSLTWNYIMYKKVVFS
jgi:putative flippase GtrA